MLGVSSSPGCRYSEQSHPRPTAMPMLPSQRVHGLLLQGIVQLGILFMQMAPIALRSVCVTCLRLL